MRKRNIWQINHPIIFLLLAAFLLSSCSGLGSTELSPMNTHQPSAVPATATVLGAESPTLEPTEAGSPSTTNRWRTVNRLGRGEIQGMTWSEDGSVLFVRTTLGVQKYDGQSYSADGFIEIPEPFTSLAIRPDGSELVTSNEWGDLKFWAVDEGSLTVRESINTALNVPAELPGINLAAFSPSGDSLVTARYRRLSLWINRAEDGFLETQLRPLSLRFNPSGDLVAVLYEQDPFMPQLEPLGIVDVANWEYIHRLPAIHAFDARTFLYGPERNADLIDFDDANGQLAYPASDGTVSIIEPRSNEQVAVINVGDRTVTSLSYDPEGARLALGDMAGSLQVWSRQDGEFNLDFMGHQEAVTAVTFSRDSQLLLSGSLDSTLRLWDANSGEEALSLGTDYFPANTDLFSITGSDSILLVSPGLGVRMIQSGAETIAEPVPGTDNASVIAVDPTKLVLSVGLEDMVRIIDLADFTVVSELQVEGAVSDLSFDPLGEFLAISSTGMGGIQVWQTAEWDMSGLIELDNDGPFDLEWSVSGGRLAAVSIAGGGAGKEIFLVDPTNGETTSTLIAQPDPATGTEPSLTNLRFSPDGQVLVGETRVPSSIRVWRLETGEETILEIPPLEAGWGREITIRDLEFSSDGQYLFGAGSDGHIRLWSPQDNEYLEALEGHKLDVTGLDFDDGQNRLFSTSLDGTVLIWERAN